MSQVTKLAAAVGMTITHLAAGTAPAQSPAALTTASPQPEQTYCGSVEHRALDFLIGDWQVFEKNKLTAFAHVEKQLRGCVLIAHTNFLDDKYRRPGQPFRFESIDMMAYSDGAWYLLGTDIMGGTLPMKGERHDERTVDFTPVEPRKGVYIRAQYQPLPDGDVLVTGQRSLDGRNDWKPFLEYLYKRNR